MAAPDANTLMEEAKCYLCLGITLAEALELALLARIQSSSSGDGSLVYRALISQVGNAAPTAIVLESTIGAVVWSRSNVGDYVLTGNFPLNKTLISQQSWTDYNNLSTINVGLSVDNNVGVNTFDISSFPASVPADSVMSNFSLEIRVYP